MPFQLSKKETFLYPVKVKVPADNGGGLEVRVFTGEFKRLKKDRILELYQQRGQNDRKLLDEVWVGWKDVQATVSRDGVDVQEDLPVTPANREILLAEPGVEWALVNAWLDACIVGPSKN